jgi:hypothetical protein
MVYSTIQHPPPPSHTLPVYPVHLIWEGGEVREKVEGKPQSTYFPRDETGLVCLPTQLERTLQLSW